MWGEGEWASSKVLFARADRRHPCLQSFGQPSSESGSSYGPKGSWVTSTRHLVGFPGETESETHTSRIAIDFSEEQDLPGVGFFCLGGVFEREAAASPTAVWATDVTGTNLWFSSLSLSASFHTCTHVSFHRLRRRELLTWKHISWRERP